MKEITLALCRAFQHLRGHSPLIPPWRAGSVTVILQVRKLNSEVKSCLPTFALSEIPFSSDALGVVTLGPCQLQVVNREAHIPKKKCMSSLCPCVLFLSALIEGHKPPSK